MRQRLQRAMRLADRVLEQIDGSQQPGLHRDAKRLRESLAAVPTMQEVLAKVPGTSVTERARAMGLSRQGFYNLLNGVARPDMKTVKILSHLTGYDENLLREIW